MCFKVWEELTIPVYAKQPRYGDGTRGAYIRTLKNPRVPFYRIEKSASIPNALPPAPLRIRSQAYPRRLVSVTANVTM